MAISSCLPLTQLFKLFCEQDARHPPWAEFAVWLLGVGRAL